jgi:hypothetical protein
LGQPKHVSIRSGQHIDALFTDIYLKDSILGGCELAHQAIALRPELRVLYTTGNFVTVGFSGTRLAQHFALPTMER